MPSLFHQIPVGPGKETVEIFPGDGNGIVDVASIVIMLIIDGDSLSAGNLFVLQCCEPGRHS